ncbi:MAG: glycosyltransferase, partial [Bacteroidota bacterium]
HNSYSVLTPYFENKKLKKQFYYTLKYVSKPYKRLSAFIRDHVHGIIASDIEYHIPLLHIKKYKGMIPNPINVDKIQFQTLPVEDKIRIFHGINTWNYTKKGNRYFEAALQRIVEKYPGRVIVKTAKSVPYNTYINMYNDCHILLDQVYSYDQGYNALEAMAKGKVVFTGAEAVFTQHYKLTQPVAVNALPDVDYLVEKLSFFIENPQEITIMGENARAFIEDHHHYVKVAGHYLKTWMDNSSAGV